jgi:cell division inhibitor SulA
MGLEIWLPILGTKFSSQSRETQVWLVPQANVTRDFRELDWLGSKERIELPY